MEKTTKERIRDTFLGLLSQKSLDQITVKNIIEEAGVNRNTFYYYYKDIYALIDGLYEDGEIYLAANTTEDHTYYDAYCHFYEEMLPFRTVMLNLYHSKGRERLLETERKLAMKFVKRFVLLKARGYDISEEEIDFITYFYSATFYMNLLYWLDYGMRGTAVELIERTAESFEASIDSMIHDAVVHTVGNVEAGKKNN